MTDQVVWSGDTRTEVSKLIISTNELTSKVITLLNAISGNFDGLVGQLEEATSAVNGGVADLSNIKADIESSIRRAQEDMGNISTSHSWRIVPTLKVPYRDYQQMPRK